MHYDVLLIDCTLLTEWNSNVKGLYCHASIEINRVTNGQDKEKQAKAAAESQTEVVLTFFKSYGCPNEIEK